MSIHQTEKGFTLIELMIALLIATIVSIAIYQAALSQERSSMTQKQITELQQSLRAALYLMEREIRLAGFDNSPGRTSGAGFVDILQGTAKTTQARLPGRVIITADLAGGNTDGIDNNGVNGIDDAAEANWSDGVVDDANDLNITYGLYDTDANNDGIPDGVVARLGRKSCNPNTDCSGVSYQPVADNIQYLLFEYGLDTNDDNFIDSWVDNAVGATGTIKAVRVWILGRTRNPIRDEMRDTQIYQIGRNTDGSVRRNVGPYNDQYRRRLVNITIKCRNML